MPSPYTNDDLSFATVPSIEEALRRLTIENLSRDDPDQFEAEVRDLLEKTVRFGKVLNESSEIPKWGHDHDFGAFQVPGRMGTRHIWMLSRFIDCLGFPIDSIRDRKVLDVGCWSGGVSLILNQFGGQVLATDYSQDRLAGLRLMMDSFSLDGLQVDDISVYDLEERVVSKDFDFVFCLGVLYHLTDPILALRRIYNVMADNGVLLVESMSWDSDEVGCEYWGPTQPGRNWFLPSPRALNQWLTDTGFVVERIGNGVNELEVTNDTDPMGGGRCFAIARKQPGHFLSDFGLSAELG